MARNTKEWLDHLVDNWVSKGWITAEAQEKIRNSYDREAKRHSLFSPLPLYALLAILGLSVMGVALIWGAFLFWYHVPAAVRIGTAALLLLLTQIGVGVTMHRERQGTLLAEGVALVHILAIFAALAMAEQTFYVGWDLPAYVMACAVLFLPAAYFLHSLLALVLYDLALLYWSAAGGPETVFGGMVLLWVLLALTVPLYHVFVSHQEKKHLAVFSWAMTITVFAAFSLASYASGQLPFLVLGSLAVTMMLAGYSIDREKTWGLPFRWFGRLAAAGALLFSCLPSAWDAIAQDGISSASAVVTAVLIASMLVMLFKTVHARRGAAVYFAIPCILALETILVHAGLYSSLPLVLSSAYTIFVGFYEISQGFQTGKSLHLKFGILLFIALLVTFFFGTDFSPLFPLLVMIVLGLAAFQLKRSENDKEEAALRASRRIRLRHQGTQVRGAEEKNPSAVQYVRDSADDAAMMAEWMKDLHLPSPEEIKGSGTETVPEEKETKTEFTIPKVKEEAPPDFTFSLPEEKMAESEITPPAGAALPQQMLAGAIKQRTEKEEEKKTEDWPEERTAAVPPVVEKFVLPEEEAAPPAPPLPQAPAPPVSPVQPAEPVKKHSGSPWRDLQPPPKRKKHFTRSPWSHEGGEKK